MCRIADPYHACANGHVPPLAVAILYAVQMVTPFIMESVVIRK